MDGKTTGLSAALAAYGRAMGAETSGAASGPATDGGEPAASFTAVLEQTLLDARAAGQRGEAASLQAISGKASLQEVVEAVSAAEVTLQTVVALRDRVISAYQEIIRMPI